MLPHRFLMVVRFSAWLVHTNCQVGIFDENLWLIFMPKTSYLTSLYVLLVFSSLLLGFHSNKMANIMKEAILVLAKSPIQGRDGINGSCRLVSLVLPCGYEQCYCSTLR